MTERYAVIGHPVSHSQSPSIHARFAQITGQKIEYGRIEAPLDGFERAVGFPEAAHVNGKFVVHSFVWRERLAELKTARTINFRHPERSRRIPNCQL